MVKRFAQSLFDVALRLVRLHINEVNDDQPAQVTQPKLSSDLFSGLKVRSQSSLFNVGPPRGPCRVHVNGNKCLGMVNDQGTTGWQLNHAGVGCLDLVLNLKAREQRDVILIALDPGCEVGHHMQHKLLSLVVNVVGVDKNLADVRLEVVPNGAND